MVVRNGIILLDYAREIRERDKLSVREAALAAGKRRMRPIFLTSAAASVGVIPMILSRSLLWGPLGTVICFGLLISMVLTLYILPVIYALAYTDKPKKPGFWSVPPKRKAVIGLLLLLLAPLATQAQTLSLDSCKQLALINNKKIKEADYDVKAAEEQRKEAFTNYFPKVSANAIALRSADYLIKGNISSMNLPVYDGNVANVARATQYAYVPSIPINLLDYLNTAAVSVTMPIYVGGRIRNGNKLASIGEEVSRGQKEMTTTEVLVHTEELYWSLTSLKEKEKTILSYKVMLDTLYRDVNSYTRAGMVQRNDLLKVQLKQNELQTNLLKLGNGITITKMALCQHIGIAYDSTLAFNSQPLSSPALVVQPDAQSMVSNRVEYTLLNKAVEAGELQQKMARGEYLPQLAVTGMGFALDMMDNTSKNGIALVTLSIPISDWWGGAHKMRQQRAKIEKARTQLNENNELIALQIEQAGNELKENYFQIQVAKKSVEQARENLKITNDNYKAGTIAISDLLEAQALFQGACDNLTDSQCNYQIKLAKYLQSIGRYK